MDTTRRNHPQAVQDHLGLLDYTTLNNSYTKDATKTDRTRTHLRDGLSPHRQCTPLDAAPAGTHTRPPDTENQGKLKPRASKGKLSVLNHTYQHRMANPPHQQRSSRLNGVLTSLQPEFSAPAETTPTPTGGRNAQVAHHTLHGPTRIRAFIEDKIPVIVARRDTGHHLDIGKTRILVLPNIKNKSETGVAVYDLDASDQVPTKVWLTRNRLDKVAKIAVRECQKAYIKAMEISMASHPIGMNPEDQRDNIPLSTNLGIITEASQDDIGQWAQHIANSVRRNVSFGTYQHIKINQYCIAFSIEASGNYIIQTYDTETSTVMATAFTKHHEDLSLVIARAIQDLQERITAEHQQPTADTTPE